MNARQTQGTALLITALGLLVVPGVLVNNLQANGLIGTSPATTCPSGETLNGNFCVSQNGNVVTLNSINPCTLNPSNCNLTGASFQVLNPCSTWTNLLTLNYIGLVSSFFSSCGQSAAQSGLTSTSFNNVALPVGNVTFSGCTDLKRILNAPPPAASYVSTEKCTSVTPATQLKAPFYLCYGCYAPYWNGVVGNRSLGSVSSLALAVVNDSSTPAPNYVVANCLAYGSYTGSPGAQDVVAGNVIKTMSCSGFASFVAGSAGSSGGLNVASILGFIASIVGLTLVVVIGLGLNVGFGGSVFGTGTSGSVGSNPQGTKLAQTLGLGLLLWFPLYSEFDTWFTNGYLPVFNNAGGIQTGLDGNILAGQIGIVSIILTLMTFLGFYFLSQAGSGGHSS